jgi:lipocalin
MYLFLLILISISLFKHYPKGLWVSGLGLIAILQGCSPSVPAGIKPVTGFDVKQYLGHWYEIARLDNRFQRGLVQVTAAYSLREDGGICVERMQGGMSRSSRKKQLLVKPSLLQTSRLVI